AHGTPRDRGPGLSPCEPCRSPASAAARSSTSSGSPTPSPGTATSCTRCPPLTSTPPTPTSPCRESQLSATAWCDFAFGPHTQHAVSLLRTQPGGRSTEEAGATVALLAVTVVAVV